MSFTKVLDTYQEIDDGTNSDAGTFDRGSWEKTSPIVVKFADYFLSLARAIDPDVSLVYVRNYIAISGKKNYVWIRPRSPKKRNALVEFRTDDTHWDDAQETLQNAGFAPNRKDWSFVLLLNEKELTPENSVAFSEVLQKVRNI